MINILDKKTDELVGWISSVITDSHQNSISNQEVYNFQASKTEPHIELVTKRARIIILAEEGDYREFIVQSTRESTLSNSKEVTSTGSFLDLNKLKIINPQVLDGQTVRTAASYVLVGVEEWEIGIVEYGDAFRWVIERHMGGYDAFKEIARLSGLELRFRITTDGHTVSGRYVDFIKRKGMNRGKEIEFGKDLMGITRKIHAERIVTSLRVIGPQKENGTNLEVTVTNDAAFQNWNRKNKHLTDVYEPQVDDDITLLELTKIGEAELQKRIDAVVEYEIESVALEHVLGHEHEVVMMGDTAFIKDEYFNPPLYLNARAVFIERSVFNKVVKKYKLGEVIEYTKEDVMKTWRGLQKIYGAKIIASPTPPVGRKDVLWIKTGGSVEIAHRWDSILNRWLPVNGSITWMMYAEDENGLNMSSDATGRTYVGFAYNQTEETPSTNPLDYNWSLFQGPRGVEGPTGPDGEPTFTWIKYALDDIGTDIDDDPTGRDYMGIAYNQTTQSESLNPSLYTWTRFRGDKGEKGDPGYTPIKGTDYFDGDDGQKGDPGASSYLWVRYSQVADGSGMVTSPTNAKYVGIATTTIAIAPTVTSAYSWSLIKGDDGVIGESGPSGNTSYLHIKYSENGTTFTANNGETVGAYIGTYVDFTQADSLTFSAYTWNKVKGETGASGVGVVSIVEQYYLSTSATTQTGGTWGTTVPTWVNGRFMWTRSVISYSDSSTSTTLPANVTGSQGSTGSSGVGISSVDVQYYLSISATSLVGGSWSTTAPAWTDGYYMWSKTVTTYTNGSVTESTPANITGAKGETGATGDPGKGVSSIVEQYYLSTSGTTQTGGAWSTTVPAWVDGKYIWTRSVITYTDSTSTTTTPVNVTGGKGSTGGTGVGVSNVDVWYYLSTSATTQTGGAWSTTAPAWVDGRYMWSKTVVTYTNATTDESTPANITGAKGATGGTGGTGGTGPTGPTGPAGKGVTSIVEEYYYSTSSTTQTGGAWSTTVPTWVDGKFMWTRAKTTFTDASTAYTSPVNVTGQKGTNGVTTYTWVRYADDINGAGINDSPSGKRYMGIAVNKTSSTESNTPGDYIWSPLYEAVTPVSGGKIFKNPDGASFYHNTSITGALIISTPILSSFMTTIRIKGYNYATNYTTIDLTVSFYAYTGGIINHSFVSNGDFAIKRVRVGRDASNKAVLIIGDTNTAWSYPALGVESAQMSYNVPPDSYQSGWSTAISTTIPTLTALAELAGSDIITDIGTSQATANGKNTVFYATAAPSTTGRIAGDIWFDTDDGNKMYGYNGGWVAEQFGVNAIADLAITNAKIADATISDAKISNLNAAKITAGVMSADRIDATTLSAIAANLGTVTAGILRNATSTNVIDMNAGTISLGSGNFTVSGSTVTFKGTVDIGTTSNYVKIVPGTTPSISAQNIVGGYINNSRFDYKGIELHGTYSGGFTTHIINNQGKDLNFSAIISPSGTATSATFEHTKVSMVSLGLSWALSFDAYGGTIHMSDTTWIRMNKSVYIASNNFQTEGNVQTHTLNVAVKATATVMAVTQSGQAFNLDYVSGGHGYMAWIDGTTRTAYMGYTSNGTNLFELRLDKALGFYKVSSQSGMELIFDALSDGHTRIRGSNGPIIKFLKSLSQVQFRNYADSGYSSIVSSGHTAVSQRALKKNITPYEEDALQEILTTPIREYHFNEDRDWEPKRVGIILDEAPLSAINLTGQGVVEYQMVSMAWRAIQQLKDEISELNTKILEMEVKM